MGQVDEDINEEGIEQAKAARETVKNMNFDVIYCSPLLRAKHTCEIVNCNNVPVIYDDRLKERTLGELDGKDLPKEQARTGPSRLSGRSMCRPFC